MSFGQSIFKIKHKRNEPQKKSIDKLGFHQNEELSASYPSSKWEDSPQNEGRYLQTMYWIENISQIYEES